MTTIRLQPRLVAKPWGRRDLPAPYGPESAENIGEVIFDNPDGADAALLLKLLFTSQKLSVQVHPDDAAARVRGHARGKDEAWLILAAEPGACIAFGLLEPMERTSLREAALDGSIERLLDWRTVQAGDVLYSPAGTIHAIGPGLSLAEIQQNLDLTYRLYDYGRPRPLQLDDAVAVADLGPAPDSAPTQMLGPNHVRLAGGAAFQVERLEGATMGTLAASSGQPLWLLPLAGDGLLDGEPLVPLTASRLDGDAALSLSPEAQLVVAYSGGESRAVWRPA